MDLRLQKYKKNRLKGMNKYNAARAAGYSISYSKRACKIEEQIKEDLRDVFEQRGLTDQAIVDFAIEGMYQAKKLFGKEGVEYPDWQAKHKFFESICKITDRLKEKHEHTGKDGGPLPTPIINFYAVTNNNDKHICTTEGSGCSTETRI